MAAHDNPALEKSYKILKNLNEEELDAAYDILFNRFGNCTKFGKNDSNYCGKKTITIDFDGVIHNNTSPYTNAGTIPDNPVKGVFKWLETLVYQNDFDIVICSSRCKYDEFKSSCISWFARQGLPEDIVNRLSFSATKPPSWIHIDDRVFLFIGNNFPSPDEIRNFKPWNK